jgi:hypothetical protein
MKILIKSAFFVLLTVLAAANLFGQQASYSGVIGDSPVTFVTDIYSDGVGTAVYVYDKYDEPIRLSDGKVVKNKLSFTKKDAKKMTRATLTFDNYDGKAAELKGVWKDAKTGKTLDIKLKKDFETDYGSNEVSGEFIQGDALPDRYFKVAVKGDRAVAVKVLEKKSDRLLQTVDVDTQQRGADGISVGDYNFDGVKDFSIFESSYAGPNTSSLYYLYDPAKKQFFNSGWEGTSLEFDEKKKMISSTNSCCAGSIIMTATYKVVKNKMVLVSETCMKYDEKKGELVKRPIKACQ